MTTRHQPTPPPRTPVQRAARPCPRAPRGWGERGSASIQMVLLLPALFAVMFLGLQAALSYHARTIALAAATEGARAAGAEHASSTAGAAAARSYLADTGGDALTGAVVTARRTATTATVTVRGDALSVLPGFTPGVAASASVAVERLTR